MSKRYLRRVLSSIVLLITITAFTISPFAHTLPADERLGQDFLDVQQGDYPEWEETIKTTFQALGITQFGFNKYNPTGYLGAIGTDAAQVNAVSLTIMETEYVTLSYPDDDKYESTTFHSHSATLMSHIDIYGKEYAKGFTWGMNGTYYYVFHMAEGSATVDDLLYYAEALYNAATGSTPSAPASPPSDPAPPSPPSGLCADVNCKNNYCKDESHHRKENDRHKQKKALPGRANVLCSKQQVPSRQTQ